MAKVMDSINEMSKTYQYRKVMKPMLERKRRARINKCLDELKDLMVATLESEGEHVTRLEKADILELTVSHLQKMKQQKSKAGGNSPQSEGFRSGYIHAVNEVSRSLSEIPGVNVQLGTQLMTHLGQRLNQIHPTTAKVPVPVTAPLSVHIGQYRPYSVPLSPVSSYTGSPNSNDRLVAISTACPQGPSSDDSVWRPW